ncbi:dihydrofolate reductase [Flavobacteriaceae bacterium]|nr:dihydrofolate reductase [Flavobacteriaceae bacterium]
MNSVSKEKQITIIAAAAANDVLGKDNQLIWHLPEDLKRFKKLTSGHAIIMGRKTFESMPKALPNRLNIVITKNKNYQAVDALVCHSIAEALALAGDDEQPFIIGGGEIYREGMSWSDTIELTRIDQNFEGDTFFPKIDDNQWEVIAEKEHPKTDKNPIPYRYITYKKTNK